MSGQSEARQFVSDTADDARAQIEELRRKVESLLAERSTSLSRAVDKAEVYAGTVADKAQRGYDEVQDRVRERPGSSLLIAAAVGFVLGRLLGR
ncbi:hypothetical protein LPC08_08225 [Roseomonas sp. OT10]|uniref:DUF883 family protein n=1 Tax=Roseomonas cutis TaxID=2897332 RepID=UPI001E537914|nr:hypothetical protein [Roseomonas sp. OT10]UFN50588.1 hypothetical protein LPC08_08225 [Roseomonas sp. OT10]